MLRPAAAVPIAMAGVLLAACVARPSASPGTPSVPGTVEVRLTCATGDQDAPCAFRPGEVTVPAGGTVRWVNDDATYHTVTSTERGDVRRPSGHFHGVLDQAGEMFSVSFAETGTYPYYCQPHAEFMAGIVHVVSR